MQNYPKNPIPKDLPLTQKDLDAMPRNEKGHVLSTEQAQRIQLERADEVLYNVLEIEGHVKEEFEMLKKYIETGDASRVPEIYLDTKP